MNEQVEKSAPGDRASAGPLDMGEVVGVRPLLDFGSIKVPPRDDMQVRLEVAEDSQKVVAITFELSGSTLQVQPYAAARSEGLWLEIRDELAASIKAQGGETTAQIGALGPELIARIPGTSKNEFRMAKFIGVDGPRWFLRGEVSGAALLDPLAAGQVDDLFRSLIVDRGDAPIPPREFLELRFPPGSVAPPKAM